MYNVTFKIEGGEDVKVFAVGGENVLELARSADVAIDAPCSGNGTCGKCRVKVLEGIESPVIAGSPRRMDWTRNLVSNVYYLGDCGSEAAMTEKGVTGYNGSLSHSRHLSENELADGWRLACEATISGDVVFFVPDSASSYIGNITTEIFGTVPIRASKTDELSSCLAYGLAIDIGTTTVSALLVETGETGDVLAKATTGNAQVRYGADVINRIIEQQKPGGIQKMQNAIVKDTLIPLIDSLCKTTGVPRDRIKRLTIAANTTMNHLLSGVDANSIRLEPYEPAFLEFDIKSPASIGINLAPDAEMLIAPNVGSYVGGDITAGVLGTGAPTGWQMWPSYGEIPPGERYTINGVTIESDEHPQKMSLLIDLGTNGEIVLSNREFMMTCACSAGPAFEGGDISCGMRATVGAIEACTIDKNTLEPTLNVIGGAKPSGLCGSGLIDVVAELFRAGAIDGKGRFIESNGDVRIRHDEYGAGSYILAFAADSATGDDITLTETDLDNFIRAKGAIFSGIISLLLPLGFTPADIDDVFVAGGIGSGINIESAIRIGMLPDLPGEKYRYLGNTALDGAYSMLLPLHSEQALEEVNDIARNMTYIDLSTQPGYMDEFIAACFLPHTDETLFPSLKE